MTPPVARLLLRATPSIAPISNRALLSVTGSQATQFLNGLLSSSIQDLPKNQFSSFLHAQGRVLHDLFLYATPHGYLLEYDSRPSEAPSLMSYLKRHILRSKVKIRDASEEYDVWASWGSRKDTIWETQRQWNWARSGAVEPVWDVAHEWPWGTEEYVIHDRRAINMGRRLLVKKGDLPQDAGTHDLKPPDSYTLHRILQGVPEGVVDIPPMQAFPMDSNLDIMGGLDFRKGCYVGQELTVRTYHTGVIRKRIVPVAIHQIDKETELAHCSFADSLTIKPINSNPEISRPPPRGSGKLLSTHSGVGLALMRLEHLTSGKMGDLKFELTDSDSTKWQVSPWWPDWWPSAPPFSTDE